MGDNLAFVKFGKDLIGGAKKNPMKLSVQGKLAPVGGIIV